MFPSPRSPHPLSETVDVRTPIVLEGVCTSVCHGFVCVCMHRSRSNRTRVAAQCRTASGRESESFALLLAFHYLLPGVLFETASSFIRQCAVGVSSRDRISRLFYACAFIADSKYRPIPISRSAFLTTIFHTKLRSDTHFIDDDSHRFFHEKCPGARKTLCQSAAPSDKIIRPVTVNNTK